MIFSFFATTALHASTAAWIFVEALKPYGLDQKYAHIAEQRGMFSYTGLSAPQCERLQDEFHLQPRGGGGKAVARNLATFCLNSATNGR